MNSDMHGKFHSPHGENETEDLPTMSEKDLAKEADRPTMPEEEKKPYVMSAEEYLGAENMDTMSEEGGIAASSPAQKGQDFKEIQREGAEKKAQDEKRKKRNFWIKFFLLFVLIGVSIYTLFPITQGITGENAVGFIPMVKGASFPYFLLLLGVTLLFVAIESFQYSFIFKTATGKFRFRNSVKVSLLGKYYDAVTPLGTGGQPFQIYYLHKKDIPKGVATATPLVKYTFSTFARGILSIIFFALVFVVLPPDVYTLPEFTAVYVVAWVSMFLNMLIPAVMIFGSLFPKAGKKLVIRIVALLAKMRIVKRKYTVTKKYVKEMGEYRRSLKEILKQWWIVIPLLIIALVTTLVEFSLPFFTVTALANATPSWGLWAQMFCGGLLSFYSASLFPTPGNSGMIEFTSSIVFGKTLSSVPGGELGPVSTWIIITWRFLTFYVFILAGLGINIFDAIRNAVRNRRAKKEGR